MDWGDILYSRPRSQEGTWWPVGEYWVPHGNLSRGLIGSAQHHARQAVRLFVSDDHDEALQAAVSVGCSLELLAKAFLASIEPALLAEKGERDAILVFTNKGHLAVSGPTAVKSITAQEALKTAKHLHPSLAYNPQTDQTVLQVRNAAAHMALVNRDELRRSVVVMCRIIDSLLPALGLARDTFWGTHALPAVDEMIDLAKDEIRRVVAAKQAAAKQRLAMLLEGLNAANSAAVVAALAGRHRNRSDHEEPQRCPVCSQQGWLVCGVDRGPLQSFEDDDGVATMWVERIAYPISFECSLCQLALEEDELLETDFPTEIELEADDNPFEADKPDLCI